MKIFEGVIKLNVSTFFFMYCCLHYFYFGRLFKGIESLKMVGRNTFVLPTNVNLECSDKDSTILFYRFNCPRRCQMYDDTIDLICLWNSKLIRKTYTKNDMINLIKDFAIKYEKELYWNYENEL